jgi:hypothetical protein
MHSSLYAVSATTTNWCGKADALVWRLPSCMCAVHPPAVVCTQFHLPSPVFAQYNALLAVLDGVAGRQVDASLAALGSVLTEPAVARMLSRNLPPGTL